MPYTTPVSGNNLTTSLWNSNVRDQVVSQFASVAARNAAITSPIEGMMCVTTDTDNLWIYTGSQWVQVVNHGPWVTYVPSISQPTPLPFTTHASRWTSVARVITWTFRFTMTTDAGTNNTPIVVTLPFAAATPAPQVIGSGLISDLSFGTIGNRVGVWRLTAPTTMSLLASANLDYVGVTPAQQLMTGDTIEGTVTYEAAL